MQLVIFIGIQGSGKSTFRRLHFPPETCIVSKDAMGNATKKEARQQKMIREALSQQRSVIVDNTNITLAQRSSLIKLGQIFRATITAYFFDTQLTRALEQNQKRRGKARVPEQVIRAAAHNIQPPTKEEGFDHIFLVSPKEPFGFWVQPMPTQETSPTSPPQAEEPPLSPQK